MAGSGQHATLSTFAGSAATPSSDTMCPKYLISCCRNAHFLGCSFSPAWRRRSNTVCRLTRCSSKIFPSMITSSRYTRQCDHCRPARTKSIKRWKVAGALHNPKGITLNSKSPSVVQKAVFARSSSATSTCQ